MQIGPDLIDEVKANHLG